MPQSVDDPATSAPGEREVRFEHSVNLAPLLSRLKVTLLVSTYQAGKIVAIGSHQGQLKQTFHNFDRPMGVAITAGSIAVAARNQIWLLRNAPDIAPRMEPRGQHDACYLTRSAQVTGEIQAHEIAWSGDELWVVNTLFSCLCTLHPNYSFVPRWKPSFITGLAAEDRCHLNGLAMDGGRPAYVTAMAQSDSAAGWRPTKVTSGCLIEVERNETVAAGFAMPHSPRVSQGQLWLLDSGRGHLVQVDRATGKTETVTQLPGYTRGLAFCGQIAFVGLSKIRETSTFGGVPIAEDREKLKCGVAAVELSSGRTVATLEFKSGVDEIFDVGLIPHVTMPALRGPFAAKEGAPTVWTVPDSGKQLPDVGISPPLADPQGNL